MTNAEAIEFLKNMIDREAIGFVCPKSEGDVAIWQYHVEALQMAISALQAQEAKVQLSEEGTTSDCISRQAAIECLEHLSACDEPFVEIGTGDETFIGKYEAITEISDLPSAQPTLCGYDIEHLILIANVLRKENMPPERVVEALTDIGRIVSIVRDEFKETLRKAVDQCEI